MAKKRAAHNYKHSKLRTMNTDWKSIVLAELRKMPNATLAAKKARIDRGTIYAARKSDPAFDADFIEATEEGLDLLEAALYDRALKGWQEPVYQQGKLVGHTRKFSDSNGQFLLKGRRPAVFGDKSNVDVTSGGKPIETRREDPIDRLLADAEAARLVGDLARRMALKPGGNGPSAN